MWRMKLTHSWHYGIAVIILISLVSCTRTITQSAQLSEAGVKYAEAMSTLLDVTTDSLIDDDSETLLYQQKLTASKDKRKKFL